MIQNPAKQIYQWAPGAITATGTGASFNLQDNDWDDVLVGLVITGAGGTTPTLDLYLQTMGPDGNWYDVYHWAQQTGNTTASTQTFVQVGVGAGNRLVGSVGSKTVAANTLGVPPMQNLFQLAYTIGGTSPTFTPVVSFYKLSVSRPS